MMKMYDKRIEFHWGSNDTDAVAWHTASKANWMFRSAEKGRKRWQEIEKIMRRKLKTRWVL